MDAKAVVEPVIEPDVEPEVESDSKKHKRNIELYLSLKRNRLISRCSDCWLSRPDCICAKLPRLQLSDNINEIIVYMDPKEMYNAGDDAKLLLISAPLKTKRFIYGLEDDELCTHLDTIPRENIVILFPSEIAMSFPDWMCQRETRLTSGTTARGALTVIVVDGVWRHARRMAQRLREILPDIVHMQLTPEQMSIYMRKQSQADRICTVEATALFLSLFGESDELTTGMVECVRINNIALRPEKCVRDVSVK